MPARLTILSLSTIHQDGRVLREIEFAGRAGYEVIVVGWGHLDKPRPNVTMMPVQRIILSSAKRALQVARMLGGRIAQQAFEQWYWAKPDHHQALQAVIASKPDLIHANEAIALPIAIEAARRTKARVLFDAHEYSPGQRSNNLVWRILAQPFYTYIIGTYAPQADAMTTVAQGIVEKYQQEFGLNVDVIMNTPHYVKLPFRSACSDHTRLVHHGAAIRERQLEKMIDVLALTDNRYTLDFMLLDDRSGYLEMLKRKADHLAPGRVFFREPVPPQLIAETINAYDIGLYLLPPKNFNQAYALPNKFFDFIMAGLAIAIGPSLEMAAIVNQYQLGVVADSFEPEALANKLNAITAEDIDAMKWRSLQAAKELNAENEMGKLLNIYARLLAS